MKLLEKPIKILEYLYSSPKIVVKKSDGINFQVNEKLELSHKKVKGFKIKAETSDFNSLRDENQKSICFKTIELDYILTCKDVFVNTISPPFITAQISSIKTEGFDESQKQFFRFIIKHDYNLNISDYILTKVGFEARINNQDISYFRNCIEVPFEDGALLELYTFKNNNNKYLVLESKSSLNFKEFQNLSFSIINCLAFVSGKLVQNEGIFFTYRNYSLNEIEHFFYTELRDSINSHYSPICGNPYSISKIKRENAEQILKTQNLILTNDQFINLCRKCSISLKLNSIILLLIESSVATLLAMPSGFSVALEGITELICAENANKVKPIRNKTLSDIIRKEMIGVMKKYQSQIENENGYEILKTKVDNLNSPTNQSKLIKPFELLDIKLNKFDMVAIKSRNKFLHGNINLGLDSFLDEETNNLNKEIYAISLRLFTLLSALILKYIGYKGSILNYSKIYQEFIGLNLDEEYYRKI